MKKVMKSTIKKFLQNSKIGLIDIGSSGGLEPRWASMSDYLSCFLFEPDDRSYKEIVSSFNNDWVVYPTALYSKSKEITLNLCRKPQVSSLYAPNREFLNLFLDQERWDILGEAHLNAKRLDDVIADLPTRERCDFIKLDTQGSELSILEGSVEILEHVVGIEVEVEFCQLYKGQPLFGGVCSFLEKHGFSLVDFLRLVRWNRKDYEADRGQLVFADALFLKPPETILSEVKEKYEQHPEKVGSKLMRYVSICLIYEKIDYALFTCENCPKDLHFYPQLQEYAKAISESRISVSTSRSLIPLIKRGIRKVFKILGVDNVYMPKIFSGS